MHAVTRLSCLFGLWLAIHDLAAGGRIGATPAPTPAHQRVTFESEVVAGQAWKRDFAGDLHLVLAPGPYGWEIVVTQEGRDENLARLTPPFHFVPNPREIEGWHFRNSDNSGPNEPGEKNVNAPGKVREFVFSPAVGVSIDGPDANVPPTPEELQAVAAWGRGTLTILDYRLADLEPHATARLDWMRFTVTLSWPAAYDAPTR